MCAWREPRGNYCATRDRRGDMTSIMFSVADEQVVEIRGYPDRAAALARS